MISGRRRGGSSQTEEGNNLFLIFTSYWLLAAPQGTHQWKIAEIPTSRGLGCGGSASRGVTGPKALSLKNKRAEGFALVDGGGRR